MKKLPIGVSTLAKIRQDNCFYVDKTPLACQLIENGDYYFLSRPRRFGKSLLVDLFKELFSANKALFTGLYAENNWNWSVQYPVIYISFSEGIISDSTQLKIKIEEFFFTQAEHHHLSLDFKSISGKFQQLIKKLYDKYQQKVVILIDEYDKPILDQIDNNCVAAEIREELKNLYSVIKGQDAYLRFVFITGVTKFSKVSLFSGLNNLNDITLDKRYSSLCGYTQQDLETVFADQLKNADKDEIKRWYNGYQWLGESVYNPFDILLFIDKGLEFRNFWFETGTPGFLVKLLQQKQYFIPGFEHLIASENSLGQFDVEHIEIAALLFQTGYLTIQKTLTGSKRRYLLSYPNLEVKMSLNDEILDQYINNTQAKEINQSNVYKALVDHDLDQLEGIFYAFFSCIPYQWFVKNNMDQYEGFYASVFYSYFAALGLDMTAEDMTSNGRIDLTIKMETVIYIMEFKIVNTANSKGQALQQIKERNYADKYLATHKNIFLIGIEFNQVTRNIDNYQWQQV
jgi:hypothetical protein